jgi:CO/xanthine dehydrogenase Mo-binding subunit
MQRTKYVGQRVPEIRSFEKISGEAQFSDDLLFSNILYAKILRSPFAHAKIKSIDITEAVRMTGVALVLTGENTDKISYIAQKPDMYPLAVGKVRYVGDAVAAVAAETEEIAREAVSRIRVVYEPLPLLLDPQQALAADAPSIHEGSSNLMLQIRRDFGDVDKAFSEADHIFEDTYSTQPVVHCNMEPRCSVARLNDEGVLEVWTGTQSPFFVQKEVAHVCKLPISSVQVKSILSGGGFGSRSKYCEDEGVTALLALKTKRPVKTTFSREEEMTTTRIRQPFDMHIKTGLRKDGTLLAREIQMIADKGAYCHYGPGVVGYAAGVASSLYRFDNFRFNSKIVYTNKMVGGPFRGFGAPQINLAIDAQLDRIANELGLGPYEIRLKNVNQTGDVTPCGWKITSCGFEECLRKAVEATNWHRKRSKGKKGRFKRGIGMAGAIHVSGSNVFPDGEFSSIELKMHTDGRVGIYKGSGDTGTWADTVLAQIIAEDLELPIDQMKVLGYDTVSAPLSLGSFASRVCFEDGNAARGAARQLRVFLLESASQHLQLPLQSLYVEDGVIRVKDNPELSLSYGDAVFYSPRTVGHILSSSYQYEPPTERLTPDGYANTSAAFAFSVQVAEIVVDAETGEIQVERMTVVQDVGKAINPLAVEGQIEGAVVMGIGFALTEELITNQEGRVISDCFEKYLMPTSMEIPEIDVILVETNDKEGPFGAKGVGEIGLNNTAASIVNALYNATGVRFHKLPVKSEDVFFAMKRGVKDL